MVIRRRTWLVAVAIGLAALWFFTRHSPAPRPNEPGTFSFAALGDAPYYAWEDIKFRRVLRELDAHDLAWVLHIGDIFWRPCTDERYRRSRDWFNGLRHPVIYTPGDNEWTDCWEAGSGGFAPRERLDRLRQIFFQAPRLSLGGRRLAVASQADRPPFSEFVENTRWTHAGLVFATVHLVGSDNGLRVFPARTAEDVAEVRRRSEAAAAWLHETFAEAKSAHASAVVIGLHGNPSFERSAEDRERQTYEPFMTALEEEVASFEGPVLAVHGDNHVYTVDHPLVQRTTGRRLDQFTRLQVPGSPEVGWVRVVVRPGADATFSFTEHIVPWWKYW